ncbi:MAG TPA: HesA/MoeB/ThiF family protein [Dehalococcoidia bacterium]|nr:HesA/MoeB/ThiF family protein [Dehalococcoidia bacterium]
MLSREELERYDRQIMLYGFGEEGQEKLKKARVFIAGAGGLGSPVSIYLAIAGVGNIRIIDHDTVELSNLNRQILHWQENIRERKTDSAVEKLRKLNPDIKVEGIAETITEKNIPRLVVNADIIIDAMDNLETRYILNRAAIDKNIPFVHGAVNGFEGRAMTVIPGKSACLNCVYHGVTVPREKIPVIGVTPAVIGCIQATEAIKYITGMGNLLTNRLINYDALSMTFTEFTVKRDPDCEHCGKIKNR